MTAPHPPGHLTDSDFRSDDEKWAYLARAPELDAKERRILELAVLLWEAAGRDPRGFAELAHAYCRDVILYMTDTEQFGSEDIAPAGKLGDVLDRKVDDCDAKARLFVALALAVKLRAEMVPHWSAARLAHVSAKIMIGRTWVPVELTLARARLGEEPKDVPRDVTGRWNLNEARI
jgi:transglutaminase-like putative cysteine protease